MIVRMWHGRVPAEKAAQYREFLIRRALPDYRSVSGNLYVQILERIDGTEAHFITMSHCETRASIEAFAGEDIEAAKYYDEDSNFLLEFEPNVVHYEVVGQS